ncbi:recombination regulator RecX [Bacillus canaveralius]|uniref:Regulatory protein RecX n=2 Tax=Bacillaceae TaxID=186817 RepID=A0A2N5GN63_9BACI|nr:recombination regulator RecX [Bacillus canaveralius]PLR83645.1 recombination regulator RecX [Bacillus canaveralius]PLR86952.1 recombination regulator RecX [Bacillus sp. V33-4]PLR90835.1 recombination regulator RecX [Bacillus canaveralius]RSK53296.1 recombination regulator RecX [Bacillus canaveralius]
MAVITKISVQKKNHDRYNIFVDEGKGEKFAFSVDEDVLIKYQLKKGIELEDLMLTEVHFHDDIRKAYNLAINYLARRMRSEGEVREYLITKEVETPVITEVISKLYKNQFLNDAEFAAAFVRTQINTTDKGPLQIKRELKEKKIDSTVAEDALKDYSFDEQVETAEQLCRKYTEKNKRESFRSLKLKVEQQLIRKGFSFDIIQLVLANSPEQEDDADQLELEAITYQGEKLHRKYEKHSGYEYKQKMKQALYRKGFPIELIERYLQEKDTF